MNRHRYFVSFCQIFAGLLFMITCCTIIWAQQDAETLLRQGNAEYTLGNFTEAANCYRELLNRHGYSAAIFYNLANSLARQGEVGAAILNYQRALRLSPGDPDVRSNLEHVRRANGLFATDEPSFLTYQIHAVGINTWSGISLGSLIVLVLTLTAIAVTPSRSKAFFWLCSVSLVLLVVGITGSAVCYRPGNSAVIIAGEQKLHLSPFANAATTGSIQEGRLIRFGRQFRGFIHIADETGRSGWIPLAAMEPIDPQQLTARGTGSEELRD